jgi:hypothetical protein
MANETRQSDDIVQLVEILNRLAKGFSAWADKFLAQRDTSNASQTDVLPFTHQTKTDTRTSTIRR